MPKKEEIKKSGNGLSKAILIGVGIIIVILIVAGYLFYSKLSPKDNGPVGQILKIEDTYLNDYNRYDNYVKKFQSEDASTLAGLNEAENDVKTIEGILLKINNSVVDILALASLNYEKTSGNEKDWIGNVSAKYTLNLGAIAFRYKAYQNTEKFLVLSEDAVKLALASNEYGILYDDYYNELVNKNNKETAKQKLDLMKVKMNEMIIFI